MKSVLELLDENQAYLGEFPVPEDFPFHELIRVGGKFYTRFRTLYDYGKDGSATLVYQYILTSV